jgi:hypothetical protein
MVVIESTLRLEGRGSPRDVKAVTRYTKDPSEWKAIDVSFNTEWVEMLSLEWRASAMERLLFTLEPMVKTVSGLKR